MAQPIEHRLLLRIDLHSIANEATEELIRMSNQRVRISRIHAARRHHALIALATQRLQFRTRASQFLVDVEERGLRLAAPLWDSSLPQLYLDRLRVSAQVADNLFQLLQPFDAHCRLPAPGAFRRPQALISITAVPASNQFARAMNMGLALALHFV